MGDAWIVKARRLLRLAFKKIGRGKANDVSAGPGAERAVEEGGRYRSRPAQVPVEATPGRLRSRGRTILRYRRNHRMVRRTTQEVEEVSRVWLRRIHLRCGQARCALHRGRV